LHGLNVDIFICIHWVAKTVHYELAVTLINISRFTKAHRMERCEIQPLKELSKLQHKCYGQMDIAIRSLAPARGEQH